MEHSTYRIFLLDQLPEIGIDPPEWQTIPGESGQRREQLGQRSLIRDLIQNQTHTKSGARFQTRSIRLMKSFVVTFPNHREMPKSATNNLPLRQLAVLLTCPYAIRVLNLPEWSDGESQLEMCGAVVLVFFIVAGIVRLLS